MVRTRIFAVAFLASGAFSCEKQDEIPFARDSEGIATSMPYQWKTSLSTDGTLIDGLIRRDVSYDGNILLGRQDRDNIRMAMLSSKTGEILWEWDDLFDIDRNFDVRVQYQYSKYFTFHHGYRAYTLNLENGTTVQKKEQEYVALNMAGIEETYFTAGNFLINNQGSYVGNVYKGTIGASNHKFLIAPNYNLEHVDGNNITGWIGSAVPFRDSTGDILITYDYADAQPGWLGNTYIGLYNYTKQVSVYDKEPLAIQVDAYASGPAALYEGKAYYAPAKSIICIDVYTGKKLWIREFPEGFAFSGYMIADDKLLANCENTYLYALDPETGRQLWKEKSSGTSSKMAYLNGVVYFTGGGDGLLHAVEVETGKHLWRIRSPDLEHNSGAWFMRRVSVIPPAKDGEKGKVVTSSYLSAFCYEAVR